MRGRALFEIQQENGGDWSGINTEDAKSLDLVTVKSLNFIWHKISGYHKSGNQ